MIKKSNELNENKPLEYLGEFGQRLKEVRFHLKLIQREFAEKIGVTNGFISSLEGGNNTPGIFVLRKMSQALNISMDYLINGIGSPLLQEPGRPSMPSLGIDADTPDIERIRELVQYMIESPFVKFAVLMHFTDFLHKNKETIAEDKEKHKGYLKSQKKKH
jgi:transcriptional regulator with XRE-family HTH domain